jgi:hypothetical protein
MPFIFLLGMYSQQTFNLSGVVRLGTEEIVMVMLSAKAKLFLEAVLNDPRAGWLNARVELLGPNPWSQPLSPPAVQVAIEAFSEILKQICNRLSDPCIDEDEKADLVNDLGFASAVQIDLQGSLITETLP